MPCFLPICCDWEESLRPGFPVNGHHYPDSIATLLKPSLVLASPVLATSVIGKTGDISYFPSVRALMAHAGSDASIRASEVCEGTRNRMSKSSFSLLRNSLWLAAVSARRFNPELGTY
jgi:transposase